MKSELALKETRAMIQYMAWQMIASQERLSEADRAIGDGDHGVGMARGFEAVLAALEDDVPADLKALFQKIGMALITSMGGASGIIFGTWFTGGGKALAGKTVLDGETFYRFLESGLKAVQDRGKAKAGDKTMVDALIPACSAAAEYEGRGLTQVIRGAAEAAAQGMETTKSMVAAVGKAKTLGERSIGYPDPGAISTSLILKFMSDYIDHLC
jgi:phosphoenolpyruvate---glycerone phosphotransferase subunit DhaL